jgi:hypothetical protein
LGENKYTKFVHDSKIKIFILKTSTSSEESKDYKNINFGLAEQKI